MEQESVTPPVVEPTHAPAGDVPGTPTVKKAPMTTMFIGGIVGVVVIVGIIGYVVEVKAVHALSMNPTVVRIAKVLHIPAASINGTAISYGTYADDTNTLKAFYKNNPGAIATAPTDTQVSDQVLSRLIANTLVQQIASQYHATPDEKEVEQSKKDIIAGFPNQAAAENELMTKYGWTLDTYVDKVIRPVVLERSLQAAFGASTDEKGKSYEQSGKLEAHARHILFPLDDPKKEADVKKMASDVLKRALAGEDFAALAKQYGSDATKDKGGDLGWFGEGVMLPEFEKAIFALRPGQVAKDLVKTVYGFHVVKLEETRTPRDFAKFMDDQLRAADIKIFINAHNPFEQIQGVNANGATTK